MVSPLDHDSHDSFLMAWAEQKRQQIDAWREENGSDVPVELWDEYNDIGRQLKRRLSRRPAKPHDDLSFRLRLAQLETEWKEQLK